MLAEYWETDFAREVMKDCWTWLLRRLADRGDDPAIFTEP